MIDVQNGKYSFASELSKAKASAPWAALHISSAHAICGLSEINHHMKHTREKKINYICSLIEGCPKKGKFTPYDIEDMQIVIKDEQGGEIFSALIPSVSIQYSIILSEDESADKHSIELYFNGWHLIGYF